MTTYMFNGECDNSVKQAFIESYGPQPAYHADTWYKYFSDTEWRTVSITGEISNSSIPNVTNVSELEIGSAVTSIGEGAFSGCLGLGSVTIPNSVMSIATQAFYDCYNLTCMTIPNSVTSIGYGAFENCSGLIIVTFNNFDVSTTKTQIEWNEIFGNAFYDPNTAEVIEKTFRVNCIDDKFDVTFGADYSITFSPTAPQGKVMYKTSEDGEWLESDADILGGSFIGFNEKDSAVAVVIPSKDIDGNDVVHIYDSAFGGCSDLTRVFIPNSVMSIGDAFDGCTSLTSVIIPNSVIDIGVNAFCNCQSLMSVVFEGKTLAEVQEMNNYPWGIDDTSIINVV